MASSSRAELPIGFAVEPISDCEHIPESITSSVSSEPLCGECGDGRENWQCLTCGAILCSRYIKGHMSEHCKETGHSVCLSYSDLSVWCNQCESYIKSKALQDIKRLAYQAKFGQVLPSGADI
ncbi:hypothetical protein CLU79DRAFT_771622 [Phycomyces nitens]|nr:hypothetical protein CLU79DRAFT_771622 [Phycomyces nitens]